MFRAMGVLYDLLASTATLPPQRVAQSVAGPRFTAIVGADGADAPTPGCFGVAFTNAGEAPGFDTESASAAIRRAFSGRQLQELAGALAVPSPHVPPEVAAASLNALLGLRLRQSGMALGEENGLELIAALGKGKRLAVVGSFPYLKTIRIEAAQSWVLELEPEGDELPASEAPRVIPQADVVGITGSTLANGTLEGLLDLCRPDAFVVLIGPTTPLSPVLFDYGVDVLCGSLADDPQVALRSIAQEASTRRIPGMRQVSLRKSG